MIILTGGAVTGGSEADRAAAVADLGSQLKKSATGVVVAGRTGSEGETGVVGVIRADTAATAAVTTVDNLDTSAGRLAAVLGLVEQNGGGVGRYGLADERPGPGADARRRLISYRTSHRPMPHQAAPPQSSRQDRSLPRDGEDRNRRLDSRHARPSLPVTRLSFGRCRPALTAPGAGVMLG